MNSAVYLELKCRVMLVLICVTSIVDLGVKTRLTLAELFITYTLFETVVVSILVSDDRPRLIEELAVATVAGTILASCL